MNPAFAVEIEQRLGRLLDDFQRQMGNFLRSLAELELQVLVLEIAPSRDRSIRAFVLKS